MYDWRLFSVTYNAKVEQGFNKVIHVCQNVSCEVILFLCIYIYVGRGLCYGSY